MGDRKILFSCEAKLKAGVDLAKLKESDVEIKDDKVTITLPKAKLIYLNMDPQKIKEEYMDISVTRSGFSNEEKDALLSQGEKNIEASIPSLGIIENAEKNTKQLITSWLKQCNINNVEIKFN